MSCITPGLAGVGQGTAAAYTARLKHKHDRAAVPRATPTVERHNDLAFARDRLAEVGLFSGAKPQTPHVHRRFRRHLQRSTEGVTGEGKGRGEGATEATVQIGKGDVKATLGIHTNLHQHPKLSCVPHTFDFVSANDWTTSGATYPQLGAGMSCPA